MPKREDGGPAFPHHDSGDTGTRPGMSLRDWFAGQAMQGLIASKPEWLTKLQYLDGVHEIVARAYEAADAMIEARAALAAAAGAQSGEE